MLLESVISRFWKYVKKSDGCWMWTGCTSRGYGTLSSKRGQAPYKAHRLSWIIHYGDISSEVEVCHKCDNPGCVRPDHLFLGTHGDNMLDASAKKRLRMYRHGHGEENNAATLTDEEVKRIREEYTNGSTLEELTDKYHHTNIVRIVRNKCYFDPGYEPINANSRTRPHRKILSTSDVEEILSSNLSSRKLAKIYQTNKTTVLKVKKGEY